MAMDPIPIFQEVIWNFLGRFVKNPFDFFYEEDARSRLYIELEDAFAKSAKERRTFSWAELEKHGVKTHFQSSPIKAEYPQYGEPDRFDIAYLDEQDGIDFYHVPVSIAVELKLGSNEIGSDKCGGLKQDLVKLRNYQKISKRFSGFTGICLYLYQTPSNSDLFNQWFENPLGNKLLPCNTSGLKFTPNALNLIVACPQPNSAEGLIVCGSKEF